MALADAEDPFDYVIAAVESVPAGKGVSVLIKEAKALYQAGKVDEAARMVSGVGSKGNFSGGLPAVVNDPYSPASVAERSKLNRDYYGAHNSSDDFAAGLRDYDNYSTAKSHQSTAPRDLNEQALWNQVLENPSAGTDLMLSGDKAFPRSDGWKKMQATHKLPSGESITIHYQYNSVTGKAYDMKIDTPRPLSPVLQPGRTIK